jgi:NADH:ubiquinone oxidoreductase subunit 5 (subunit L)/multisubunit Na+/H+ antiporter MnhA subunit
MTAATLIVLAPGSLLLGAVLQILIARLCSARTKGIVAVLTCLPAVIAVVGMLPFVQTGQAIDLNLFGWDGPLALVLHVDALSVLFAFMGSCLGAIVLLYSIGYMARDKSASRFYFSMLIFIAGFIGLVYSANLLIFYLCWEVIGLCSFTLVGFWYTNRESVAGARKVLLMTHIAGYGLLTGILLIYYRTGSTLWTDPAVARSFTGGSIRTDAGCAGGQVGAGSPAYLDSRSDGRADPGQRPAARGLLCEGRRLPGRAHAQLWRMAVLRGARRWSGWAPSPCWWA